MADGFQISGFAIRYRKRAVNLPVTWAVLSGYKAVNTSAAGFVNLSLDLGLGRLIF